MDTITGKINRVSDYAIIYKNNTTVQKHDYRKLIWLTKEQGPINVGEMKRPHVQNTLNWCIRQNVGPNVRKDGILYSDWIAYFTARLFDPECE